MMYKAYFFSSGVCDFSPVLVGIACNSGTAVVRSQATASGMPRDEGRSPCQSVDLTTIEVARNFASYGRD